MSPEIVLVLVDIRSAYNVGAIFRTADAAGVKKVYLIGYTPAPLDRFGRPVPGMAKTALGAENSVEWEKGTIKKIIDKLSACGYRLLALEQAAGAVDYRQVETSALTAVILGNEVDGLPSAVLGRCDVVAEIPMRGKKESLNVAVAAGIFLFSLLR